MGVYRSTFPIAAPASAVWAVLLDFERWHEWNASIPEIHGEAQLHSTLTMTLTMPGRPSAKVNATLTEVVPERRLSWHGNVGGDWFFAGTREFDLDPLADDTVLVTHTETVTGLLFPVFRAVMGSAIQRHHDGLNQALKRRAEA